MPQMLHPAAAQHSEAGFFIFALSRHAALRGGHTRQSRKGPTVPLDLTTSKCNMAYAWQLYGSTYLRDKDGSVATFDTKGDAMRAAQTAYPWCLCGKAVDTSIVAAHQAQAERKAGRDRKRRAARWARLDAAECPTNENSDSQPGARAGINVEHIDTYDHDLRAVVGSMSCKWVDFGGHSRDNAGDFYCRLAYKRRRRYFKNLAKGLVPRLGRPATSWDVD